MMQLADIGIRAWSLGELAIAVVIIAAVVAIVWIALRAMGVSPPGWLVQVLWVIVIAVVAVVAIRLILSI